MAKQGGLGMALYVGGNDISGDINSVGPIHGGPEVLDFTDITQSGFARQGGQRDGGIDFVSFFDPSLAHPVLDTLPTADVIGSVLVNPLTAGSPMCSCVAKQVGYDPNRGNDGSLTLASSLQSNGFGLEWGVMLTNGKRTDSGATAGPFFDNGASFAFGAQAYLHAFAFSGTDVTVKIQHATTSGGAYSDLITFTQITGGVPQAQRASVANNVTVNEFLKVTTVTTGGFSNLVFAVQITVNTVAGVTF